MGSDSHPVYFQAPSTANEDFSKPTPNFIDALPSSDASTVEIRVWLRTWIDEHRLPLESCGNRSFSHASVGWDIAFSILKRMLQVSRFVNGELGISPVGLRETSWRLRR
jgi:hypothetical protein